VGKESDTRGREVLGKGSENGKVLFGLMEGRGLHQSANKPRQGRVERPSGLREESQSEWQEEKKKKTEKPRQPGKNGQSINQSGELVAR